MEKLRNLMKQKLQLCAKKKTEIKHANEENEEKSKRKRKQRNMRTLKLMHKL